MVMMANNEINNNHNNIIDTHQRNNLNRAFLSMQHQQQQHSNNTNNKNNDDNNNDMYESSTSSSNEEDMADDIGLPMSIVQPILVGYRSTGIGMFGATMRWIGMPLEKIALYMNSSQVTGKNQFQQAIKLTFQNGYMSPYKVVGPASLTAWFLQYSVMGVAFQFFDTILSNIFHVQPMYYGKELMEPPPIRSLEQNTVSYRSREAIKTILSPVMAACMESYVSNRAEVQRFYGPKTFNVIEKQMGMNPLKRACGPAFAANVGRNVIMCQTSFLLTPLTYKLYFPQDQKSKTTLFWYGLGLNVFVGNVVAITQQALWGRSLDYLQQYGNINYKSVIQNGLQSEGISSFFTIPKWCSRVLMNAPAQGTLPYFYNEVLPLGELIFLYAFKNYIYYPFIKPDAGLTPVPKILPEAVNNTLNNNKNNIPQLSSTLKRTRTHYATLPTANPEFDETEQQRMFRQNERR